MANMRMDKNPMPEQDPALRRGNFDEVALGYDWQTAMDEADRCLRCRVPKCVDGCPVGVRIPAFIAKLAEGDVEGAYGIIAASNDLPAVCGRLCHQEERCERACIRGIKGEPVSIGALERFVADRHMASGGEDGGSAAPEPNGHAVAVIGSGPAGLACAGELLRRGYDVTVFDSFSEPGGMLTHGLPNFRLPREVAAKEIGRLERAGVKIVTGVRIGEERSIDGLFEEGFEAVFIGSGAGQNDPLHIAGEELAGVYTAYEVLPLSEGAVIGEKVAVLGSGDMALDAARSAVRLGAEQVTLVCREAADGLYARKEDVARAQAEGIVFLTGHEAAELLAGAGGHVAGVRVIEREPDGKQTGEKVIAADTVINAAGASTGAVLLGSTPGLAPTEAGGVAADAVTGATSRVGVFAGGDAVTGAATVIQAIGAGKRAAAGIDAYIHGQ